MTKTTLYLKYRPQKIAELDSQSVRDQLSALIASGRLPHAFLFSGPKGTGKTSAARILAKVVNCENNEKKLAEPCNKCAQCKSITDGNNMDAIEMDAASNRGIDDVRSLKEKIILSPSSARKKIYIIDEVHMLTTEAFNALLKTLEEPPDHVMFILATTDPHKLPETVKSRLTSVVFEKASETEIIRQLERVMTGEKIKTDKKVLALLAKSADGSFRDAVKNLEQVLINVKKLDPGNVEQFLFQTEAINLDNLLEAISGKKSREALSLVEEAVAKGVNAKQLTDTILTRFYEALLAKTGIVGKSDLKDFSQTNLVNLIELLIAARGQIGVSPVAHLPLEIALVKWCGEVKDETVDEKELPRLRSSEKVSEEKVQEVSSTPMETSPKEEKQETPKEIVKVPVGKLKDFNDDLWRKILVDVRGKNTRVEALLRATKPLGFDGKTFVLGVYYKFHKESLEAMENKRILEDVCATILGIPVRISYTLTEKTVVPEAEREVVPSLTPQGGEDIISAAKEVFGV